MVNPSLRASRSARSKKHSKSQSLPKKRFESFFRTSEIGELREERVGASSRRATQPFCLSLSTSQSQSCCSPPHLTYSLLYPRCSYCRERRSASSLSLSLPLRRSSFSRPPVAQLRRPPKTMSTLVTLCAKYIDPHGNTCLSASLVGEYCSGCLICVCIARMLIYADGASARRLAFFSACISFFSFLKWLIW